MSDTPTNTPHLCYRCGKEQLEQRTLRLLPGSTNITLCPDCYAVVWGWHEEPSNPFPGAQPGRKPKAEGASE